LVLHDVRAYGVRRARWVVDLSELSAGAALALDVPMAAAPTGFVAEVRALLGEVARRLRTEVTADAMLGPVVDALEALGVLGPAALDTVDAPAGLDFRSLEQLLLDPAAAARSCLQDATRRGRLATALRAAAGDARSAAGDTVRLTTTGGPSVDIDLATGAVTLSGAGTAGLLPWQLTASWAPTVPARVRAQLGATPGLALVAGYDVAATERVGLQLVVGLPAAAETLVLLAGGGLPGTPATGPAVMRTLVQALPALLLDAVLAGVREAATRAGTAAGTAVDALLDALGLADGGSAGMLLADPAGWLAARPGGLLAAVPDLVDALRSLLAPVLPAGPGAGRHAAPAHGSRAARGGHRRRPRAAGEPRRGRPRRRSGPSTRAQRPGRAGRRQRRPRRAGPHGVARPCRSWRRAAVRRGRRPRRAARAGAGRLAGHRAGAWRPRAAGSGCRGGGRTRSRRRARRDRRP
jgi:hypothetical protein